MDARRRTSCALAAGGGAQAEGGAPPEAIDQKRMPVPQPPAKPPPLPPAPPQKTPHPESRRAADTAAITSAGRKNRFIGVPPLFDGLQGLEDPQARSIAPVYRLFAAPTLLFAEVPDHPDRPPGHAFPGMAGPLEATHGAAGARRGGSLIKCAGRNVVDDR